MGDRVAAVDLPEEDLRRGVIHTRISRTVAWGMICAFALLIFGVPGVQVAVEMSYGARPQALKLFYRESLPGREELKAFEELMRDTSIVAGAVQPRVQEPLSAWLGLGNTTVVVGRGGWLFYRPGVDAVTGPGFLEPEQLRRRHAILREEAPREGASPDPRQAILEFKKQCEAAHAHLVLVPVPDKATVQPGQLSRRSPSLRGPSPPPQNPSYAQFIAEMRQAGVDVFDPTPPVVGPGEVRFLIQDTHWTPQWMMEVAAGVAGHLRPKLPAAPGFAMRVTPQEVRRLGDVPDVLLSLLPGKSAFPPQTVTIQRVLDASGSPLHTREDADVLVLGDSLCNIYSAEPMGWGESAGFVEHLALHLGRPVDAILRNGASAWATRRMLADELARGRDRLAGKKVVVWQFAARELAVGNWKLIEMRRGPTSPSAGESGGFLSLERGERLKASGVVKVIGAAARPGAAPYKDHIVAAHLTNVRDEQGRPRGEAVVYLWGMRDNKAAPAAGYRLGQTLTLRLRPWADVSRQYGSINRRELTDPALLLVDPLWAEEETP
jgi:hypothetical protein